MDKSARCHNHSDRNAHSFCHSCRRWFCVDCLNEGPDFYYCNDLLCKAGLDEEVAVAIQNQPGFCEKCLSETTDQSAGSTFTLNFVFGTRLMGKKDPCQICGSVVASVWIWFLFPIFETGRYRVIYMDDGKYLSRELKKESRPVPTSNVIGAGSRPSDKCCQSCRKKIGFFDSVWLRNGLTVCDSCKNSEDFPGSCNGV
jgi:hypothetical protein